MHKNDTGNAYCTKDRPECEGSKPPCLSEAFATDKPPPVVSQPPIRIDYSDPIYIDAWDYRDPSSEMGQK
jgi:hypothetical protein